MVRSVTFEIRWHDTQPIYGNCFQPISPAHLRRVLDHNLAQAAGLEPGKMLADASSNVEAGGAAAAGPSKLKNAPLPLSAQGQSWRLATAGGDNHARIWLVHPNIPSPAALAAAATGSGPAPSPNPPRVEYRATLRRHSGVVNCARFSPNGELLATTGDDGMVLLWIPSDAPTSAFGSALDDDLDADFAKEHWRLRTMARASSSEVYDLAWSPSGDSIVTGGTDFVARIINANDGTVIREISEHNHYVQGVAWDPLSEYIATQSSDRSVHVHQLHARNSSEIAAVHTVSRNTRLDLHRRTGSGGGPFVWDPSAKPPMKRRASSHASHASDSERENPPSSSSTRAAKRTGRSSTPLDVAVATPVPAGPSSASSTGAMAASSARAATPTPSHSVTPSPAGAVGSGGMNPPQKTPSRRSSFSGSQTEVLSPPTSATSLAPTASNPPSASTSAATPHKQALSDALAAAHPPAASSSSRSASRTRGMTPRSPSPAPPLPAIRAPPSPKQRMAATQGGQLARVGMRLYGDENFSGFFRRLTFSPDGALLVTPTGIFENSSLSTNGTTGGNGNSNGSGSGSTSHNMASSPTVAHFGPLGGGGTPRRSSDNEGDATSSSSSAAVRASPVGGPKATNSPSPSPTPQAHHGPHPPSHPSSTTSMPRSTVYLYGRGNLHRSNAPIAHLPGHKTASLVIKFSPILYELRDDGRGVSSEDTGGIAPHPTVPLEVGKQKTVALSSAASTAGGMASSSAVLGKKSDEEASSGKEPSPTSNPSKPPPVSMIGLPYRMIFAVATHDSVWIYDTQQGGPLCCFSNMHYASFTDLAWSPDGQTLMMCSTDGYCSVVVFDYGELGVPYQYASQPGLQQPAPAASSNLASISSPRLANKGAVPMSSSASAPGAPAAMMSSSSSASVNALGLGITDSTDSASSALPKLHESEASASSDDRYSIASMPATSTTNKDENDSTHNAKKRRRIAPTLQGPIGS